MHWLITKLFNSQEKSASKGRVREELTEILESQLRAQQELEESFQLPQGLR